MSKQSQIEDLYPLTPMQEGMLFHSLYAPGEGMYVGQFVVELEGPLDAAAFRAAWEGVVARHAALRTAFAWEGVEKPLQVVRRAVRLPFAEEDWRGMDDDAREARLRALLADERARGIDPAKAPLMRLTLARTGEERHRLVWSHHQMAFDGWSLPLVFRDLVALYRAGAEGRAAAPAPARPYRAYVEWLQSRDAGAAERFWRDRLAGFAAATPLEMGRADPARAGYGHREASLSPGRTAALVAFARGRGVTPATLFQAAWSLLLARAAGQDDVLFGTVVSGRPPELEGADEMVGMFLNTVPVRVSIDPAERAADLLLRLHREAGALREHEHAPLAQVQRWSEVPAGSPLFESLLVFNNYPVETLPAEGGRALSVRVRNVHEKANYPITLAVAQGASLTLEVDFDTARLDDADAARLLERLVALMEEMAARPEAAVGSLSGLPAHERRQVLAGWNATDGDYPRGRTVHALFAGQARRTPDAVAAAGDGVTLTYAELDARANRLARHLRARGVGAEDRVALLLERGVDVAVSTLAVLKAGAAYVPLDPAYPAERLAYMVEDSAARVLVTQSSLAGRVAGAAETVRVDDEAEAVARQSAEAPEVDVDPLALAYVIYTSGSTGRPKGVMVDHDALVHYATMMAERVGLAASDRVLQFASPSFDVVVEELFPAWAAGAAVVFSQADLFSPEELSRVVADEGVTCFELPTAYWHEWVRETAAGTVPPPALRLVMVGGERIVPGRMAEWASLGLPLVHVFGLTETAVTTCTLHLDAGDDGSRWGANLPVGRPVRNARVYVLDRAGSPAGIGVAGEMFIGGIGVARGYHARPALTAGRFIPDPFAAAPGARLYRTGDRVRWLEDGTLEFLGRIDQQAKVRGYRIEPAEIEAALAAHPAVRDAAVLVRSSGEGAALQAYAAPAPGFTAGPAGLHRRADAPELWPSHGEYPVYDDLLYRAMVVDERRNAGYRQALAELFRTRRTAVDVGTGGELFLARLCIEAGAEKVYAVERMEESCRLAEERIRALGLEGRVVLVRGDSREVELPELVDVCVSELLGCIGSSEGAVTLLDDARRWLKPGGVMVPGGCVTRIAAAQLPDALHDAPAFGAMAAHYHARVEEAVGHPFDVRLCVRSFPRSHLLSAGSVFEELDFAVAGDPAFVREVELEVERDGRLDGFLLWIQLYPGGRMALDALEDECSFLPMFFPAFSPGLEVRRGDVVRAVCTAALSDDGEHPDYRVAGVVRHADGSEFPFAYDSFHHRAPETSSGLHRALRAAAAPAEAAAEERVGAAELREHLRARLPEYMVPASFVFLPEIPLTPNGKVDRRALAAIPARGVEPSQGYRAPRGAVEEALAAAWAEVLRRERVGIDENFFEIGGDSILSIQVVSRARKAGVRVTPRQLFEHPTVAALARVAGEGAEAVSADQGAVTGAAPLLPLQHAFFAQEIPSRHHWNMSLLLAPRERLEADRLERALSRVAAHHDALRLRFARGEDGWTQSHAAAEPAATLERIDLSRVADEDRAAAVEREADRLQRSLDLARGPLLRAGLMELGAHGQRLMLAAHHLAVDGVSWRVLLEDLAAAYAGAALPAKTTSFQAWAVRLSAHAAAGGFDGEIAYWTDAARAEAAPLPADAPGAADRWAGARTVTASLSAEETAALLSEVPKAYRTRVDDALLAALGRTLSAWTGSDRVLVEVEGHGREDLFADVDLSRTVGYFTSLYPVLLDLRGAEGPGGALKAVKEQLRAVPGRGLGHGALRWLHPDAAVRGALAAMPRPRVQFEYMGQVDGALSGDAAFAAAPEGAGAELDLSGARPHPLAVGGVVADGRLRVTWTYGGEVYRAETVERLAAAYLAELRALVRHCRESRGGFTPSDFPLARLTQVQVDRVAGHEVEDVYPATPMQEGMLFHTVWEAGSGAYVGQHRFDLAGALDEIAFLGAWQGVVDRHAALRTAFAWEGLDRPLQVVHRRAQVPLRAEDWRGMDGDEREARLAAFLEADRAAGFDPARAPLLRLALFRTGDDERHLVWSYHQMTFDGWSLPLVFAEVVARYDALCEGRAPTLSPAPPYREYVAWLERQDHAAAERFWRGRMEGVRAATPFPAPAHVPGEGGHATVERLFSATRAAALRDFARAHGLTPNTVVQGAWALLLARHAGEDDVVFGTTVSGRPPELEGVEETVGLFINTVPVRVAVDPEERVLPWLRRIQEAQAELREHGHAPLVRVQGWSGVAAGTPLFETLLVFENYPVGDALGGRARPLRIEPRGDLAQATYPLTVSVTLAGRLSVRAGYDTARLRPEEVERVMELLGAAVEALAADPARALADVPLADDAERRRVLALGAARPAAEAAPAGATLHALFRAQAARTPDAPAVVFGGERLTYAQLDARAERIASALAAAGVGPERRVAVCMRRSADLVAALLGVWKAGGAYVPVDPAYPAERVALVVRDSGAAAVLTHSGVAPSLPAVDVPVLRVDALPAPSDPPAPRAQAGPDNLAYVIYTSGSTGTPKGVAVRHAGAVNLAYALRQAVYGACADGRPPRVSMNGPFTFDTSVKQLVQLLFGASLHPVPEEARADAAALGAWLRESAVDVFDCTPAQLRALVDAGELEGSALPADVLVAGEAVDPALWTRLAADGVRRFHNLYGPTECTVDATAARVAGALPTLGVPIAGAAAYVLDGRGRPVPAGVPGELYVGGAGVARGYLDRPAQTAERFVPDAFSGRAGARLYRTGDRARWTEAGTLEYLGRVDLQVKVRGHRVEPGEVEAALAAHPAVRACAVAAHAGPGGEARLAAYVVPLGGAPAEAELRAHLSARLPAHMVPAAFAFLDALPLTRHGKVDRRALPAVGFAADEAAYTAPRTEAEARVAAVFQEVLGVERAGALDSFFDLGGHSLLAMRAASRLARAFGVEVPVRDLFEHPTVEAMAALLAAPAAGAALLPPVAPVPRGIVPLPLSFAQERLWVLHQMDPRSAAYHVPVALRLRGRVDAGALARALTALVARHEVLRTSFPATDGVPEQAVAAPAPVALPVIDLASLDEGAREASLRAAARESAARPFDLAAGPLMRAWLVRLGADEWAALFTLHHAVTDGWSTGVLVRELSALYAAETGGPAAVLPPLPVQYADHAAWQRARLDDVLDAQLAYWRAALADAPARLELPTDRPRPATSGGPGAGVPFQVSPSVARALRALARREGATLYMVLLAAFQALLARLSGESDVSVGTPVAGRTRAEVEGLIGFFVNTLVIRTRLNGRPTARELVRRVRAAVLEAQAHQDVPFERVVSELDVPRDTGSTPLFQALFTLDVPAPGEGLRLGGARVEPMAPGDTPAKFDLSLGMVDEGGRLHGSLDYRAELWDASTARRMAAMLTRVLEAFAAGDGERPVADAELLADEDRAALAAWNDTARPYPRTTLHALVSAQARRTPDAPALRFRGGETTYAALEAEAERVARLLAGAGVRAEDRVAISLERGPGLIAAVLGTLRAGAAFVPVDPAAPAARIARVVRDARARVLLTTPGLLPGLPEHGARVLFPDAEPELGGALPEVGPDHLAYVLYTSGSTGEPKGVLVPHRGVCSLVADQAPRFGVGPGVRVLQWAPLTFDAGVAEVFIALASGATLVLAEGDALLPGAEMARFLEDEAVECAKLTPSALALLPPAALPRLRTLIVGGEACGPELPARWAPGRRFFNVYGPTEVSVRVTAAECRAGDARPAIGAPLANVRLYVLDEAGRPQPVGVPGELYAGGPGVARGYQGRPGATAERFVPDPFGGDPGGRLYRTGDRARWRADGELEFLGRLDRQVKVRGVRVEPAEVEAALASHPAVRECAVEVSGEGPSARLVGYVVAHAGADAAPAALGAHLRERLPEAMVPSAFVAMDALPRTSGGKLDRRALAAPRSMPEEPADAPASAVETVLAAVWAEVLELPAVGVHDDFFDVGGHSLLVVRVGARVRDVFQVEVPVRALFEDPTVARYAAHVALACGGPDVAEAIAETWLEVQRLTDEELESMMAGA